MRAPSPKPWAAKWRESLAFAFFFPRFPFTLGLRDAGFRGTTGTGSGAQRKGGSAGCGARLHVSRPLQIPSERATAGARRRPSLLYSYQAHRAHSTLRGRRVGALGGGLEGWWASDLHLLAQPRLSLDLFLAA